VAPQIVDRAEKVIDADGLVLAPGFIDLHGHTDTTIFKTPDVSSKAFQGVTLEVVGNCGLGVFPVTDAAAGDLAEFLRLHEFHLPATGFLWHDFAGYAEAIERLGIGINLAPLVGHAPLRIAAMGMDDRKPSPAELERMQRYLAEALRQGAWGLSTGLIYPPGSFAGSGEIVALAKVLAAHDALYASHIRNEGDGVLAALAEAIAVGRESGVRVQVSHLKRLGKENWGRYGELLTALARAREAGIDVAADQYPYAASATTLAAVVPQWAQAGGVARMLERLKDRELTPRIIAEIGQAMAAREGAAGIVVAGCRSARNREFSGQSLAAIAGSLGCEPEAAVVRLLIEEQGAVGAIFYSMSEADVAGILADPLVAVGSDGHGLDAEADAGEATHPRSYGTFPRVLARYVREQKLLKLETAVRKMTSLPAARLGLQDRGLVLPGYVADLVLFDPATIEDLADYGHPHRYAKGVSHLLVNGEMVIEKGKPTGRRPGRVLRKQ
jgi:N-acyl-D-amino-acid deacylase